MEKTKGGTKSPVQQRDHREGIAVPKTAKRRVKSEGMSLRVQQQVMVAAECRHGLGEQASFPTPSFYTTTAWPSQKSLPRETQRNASACRSQSHHKNTANWEEEEEEATWAATWILGWMPIGKTTAAYSSLLPFDMFHLIYIYICKN